jgi:hypothetical protein
MTGFGKPGKAELFARKPDMMCGNKVNWRNNSDGNYQFYRRILTDFITTMSTKHYFTDIHIYKTQPVA